MIKKTFPICFILLITCTSLYSQNRQRQNRPTLSPIEERVEMILEKLLENIELTQEQIKSSDKVFTNYYESLDDLRKAGARPDQSKIESIDKKRDTEFEALLTEPQKKKYLEIKEELFQQRRRPNN